MEVLERVRAAGVYKRAQPIIRSVWFFPLLLLIPLLLFTALGISGSSVGVYHSMLYGDNIKDPSLLVGKPRPIRSDEWVVNTQQTIIQSQSGFPRVNKNIGDGEDVSVFDVPYKDWSTIFKPQNWAFFILPLDNAFAFKWWFMGFLLIISCYFFMLTLMPGRRLLAASLSLALFFSGFVQWWYVQGTLASLYYSLIIATTVMWFSKTTGRRKKIALGALLTYLITCFALVLYPPFQIACGVVIGVFCIGYLLNHYKKWGRSRSLKNLGLLALCGVFAGMLVGLFVLTRFDVVKKIGNTAYPGQRTLPSGGSHPLHVFSSQLGYQFTSIKHNDNYKIDGKSPSNQSENSNFLLIVPFLVLPALYICFETYRRKKTVDWPLLLLCLLFFVLVLELFVTQFTPFSKLFLLDKVGGGRVLIGVGLLNLVVFGLLIRDRLKSKIDLPNMPVVLYSILVLIIELHINWHVHTINPDFIGPKRTLVFALPIPIIVYLLLRRHVTSAAVLFALFCMFIGFRVNPLYKGLEVITNTPLSQAVRSVGAKTDKRWASEGGYLQHFASMNGEDSLSGVYNVPQFELWDTIPKAFQSDYNRYAHTSLEVTDNPTQKTTLNLVSPDSFVVTTWDCSPFLKHDHVTYFITTAVLHGSCAHAIRKISYPLGTYYIYSLEKQ
jgi:hypothetical protein